jgi:hypothetical protein
MGKALARSIRLHGSQTKLAIVTDRKDSSLSSLFDLVIPLNPALGTGVAQKLFLDKYSPFAKTIFIDSDCLVYRNPDDLWQSYEVAKGFGVKGWDYLTADDSHYSVHDLGSYRIYYFDRSPSASKVFSTAREIYENRHQVGLKPFKNSPVADEPIFAMAMEVNSVDMLPWDNGETMSTALGKLKGSLSINVLQGKSRYIKKGVEVNPAVIHFNVGCQDYFIYRRELKRLELGHFTGSGIVSNLSVIPGYSVYWTKFQVKKLTLRAKQTLLINYYRRRVKERVSTLGMLGLIPERILQKMSRIKGTRQ